MKKKNDRRSHIGRMASTMALFLLILSLMALPAVDKTSGQFVILIITIVLNAMLLTVIFVGERTKSSKSGRF